MKRRARKAAGDVAETAGSLTIGALALATNIPVQTLRTWERRYGAPLPERKPSGHRVYSLATVEHLRRVGALLEAGHRAAEILPLPPDQLDALLALSADRRPPAPRALGASSGAAPGGSGIPELLSAIVAYDREALVNMLRGNWSRLGPLRFLEECAGALMAEVGEQWHAGQLEIRHEHFATACLADVLREVREPFDRQARGPRVVAAVLSGDLHEGGLLMASVLLSMRGYRVVYLGVDTPVAEVMAAASETGVHAVVVSVSTAVPPPKATRALASLRKALPRRVHLWLGGAAAPAAIKGCVRFETLAQFDEALARRA